MALVNGAPGLVAFDANGQPFSVMGFVVQGDKIVEIQVLADAARLRQLDFTALE
jgi:RNA polymerase sigma-70 factor, ECF subfamily